MSHIEEDKYEPSYMDQAWLFNVLSLLKDGGIWCVPVSEMVYKIDKTKKRLIVQKPASTLRGELVHGRTIKVARAIGWEIVEKGVDKVPPCG